MKTKLNPKSSVVSAKKTIEVEFAYESPTAKEVYLAGDFNNWSFNSLPMRKDEKGVWLLRLPLTVGRHEYRYIVDGDWQNDPCAGGYASNGFGSCNCVAEAVPE
jgi:1,4-alpha-glucan branching enzyme